MAKRPAIPLNSKIALNELKAIARQAQPNALALLRTLNLLEGSNSPGMVFSPYKKLQEASIKRGHLPARAYRLLQEQADGKKVPVVKLLVEALGHPGFMSRKHVNQHRKDDAELSNRAKDLELSLICCGDILLRMAITYKEDLQAAKCASIVKLSEDFFDLSARTNQIRKKILLTPQSKIEAGRILAQLAKSTPERS